MFSKNNLYHILILALGFFACSSIYMTQNTILSEYTGVEFANLITASFGNLAMALGILAFVLLYKKIKNIKRFYIVAMILSIVFLIVFCFIENVIAMSILIVLYLFLCTSGFCGGYHFSLIAYNIESGYRGRVFAIGYAIGSLSSFIMSILPKSINASYICLFIYVPVIIVNIILVYKGNNMPVIEKIEYTLDFKKIFCLLSILVVVMAFLSLMAADVIPTYSYDVQSFFGESRIFYAIGLIIAGVICDKKKEIFNIVTVASFVFFFLGLFLFEQQILTSIIIGLTFGLYGFFTIFRTTAFMDLSKDNKNYIVYAAFGLMLARVVEGIAVYFKNSFIDNFFYLVIAEAIALCILLITYFVFYNINHKTPKTTVDKVKEVALQYDLSSQEEKVLSFLIQDMSNQEIADELYISVNTIKNHNTRIYKKTGMNKKELREKCLMDN